MNEVIYTDVKLAHKTINKKSMPVLVWKRGYLPIYNKVTNHFSLSEFQCPCSVCEINFITIPFLIKFAELREIISTPIKINSGFRCANYQNVLRLRGYNTAVGISQHQLGNAADITCADMDKLNAAAPIYFDAIGTATNWMHVDGRRDKRRRWGY